MDEWTENVRVDEVEVPKNLNALDRTHVYSSYACVMEEKQTFTRNAPVYGCWCNYKLVRAVISCGALLHANERSITQKRRRVARGPIAENRREPMGFALVTSD